MSQTSVIEFIEIAKADNNLRHQLEAAENSVQVQKIAIEKGYDFTEEQILVAFQEQGLLVEKEQNSLSETELEVIAGGKPEYEIYIEYGSDGPTAGFKIKF